MMSMRTIRPARRFRRLHLLGTVLALLCFAADARADGLTIIFAGTTPSGSNTTFHYDLVFTTVVNAGTPAERWVKVNPLGYQALAQRHRTGVAPV